MSTAPQNSERVTAKRKQPQNRYRRLALEQLETRELLSGSPHGLPSGEFMPPDDRVSQTYWEVSELIRLGRTDELPPHTTPMTSESSPGYQADTISYDDHFHLHTELFTLGTSPELLSQISGIAIGDCPSYSLPIELDISNAESWSRTICWIDPENLDRVLKLPALLRVDFVQPGRHRTISSVFDAISLSGEDGGSSTADTNPTIASDTYDIPVVPDHVDQRLARVLHHVSAEQKKGSPRLSAHSVADSVAVDANSLRLDPDGSLLATVYFQQGQQSVADKLKEAGIRVGRGYIPHGVLEAWIHESDLGVLSGIEDLLYSELDCLVLSPMKGSSLLGNV